MTKRAIIHVENTEGIIDFAKYLNSSGWIIHSADKTEEILKQVNIPVIHEAALSENGAYTEETCNLVKRILNTQGEDSPLNYNSSTENDVTLVCMNVEPKITSSKDAKPTENFYLVPSFKISVLIRDSVSNSKNVLILTDPADYKEAEIHLKTDNITKEFRSYLAAKALNMVSAFDSSLAYSYLIPDEKNPNFMNYLTFPLTKTITLHGGANTQQDACLYTYPRSNQIINSFRKIQGKELNYNIISDMSLAWELISALHTTLKNQLTVKSTNCDGYNYTTQFTPLTGTVCTILVKYNSILGASLATNVLDSFKNTNINSTEISQDASLGCSAVIDESAAQEIVKFNFAAIIAPGFTAGAQEILDANKNIRLIPTNRVTVSSYDLQMINEGILFQTKDSVLFEHWNVKTKMRPSQYITDEMAFGTVLSIGSRTYCAVLLKNNAITGISQASKSAIKAIELAMNDKNSNNQQADLLICDTAVPLCEPIKALINQGIIAIIQPGGCENDDELVKYCDEHGVTLVFTGMNHIYY